MRKQITLFCSLLAVICKGSTESSVDIVNGHDAEPKQIPYQISMQFRGIPYCSGTVYNENYILTAAHCIQAIPTLDKEEWPVIVAGTINFKEPGQIRKMEKIIMHEDYSDEVTVRNDIGLVKLDRPLEFNSKVQPVTLVDAHSPLPTGTPLQVSGWGNLIGASDEVGPTILQIVTVYVADQDYCVEVIKSEAPGVPILPTNICTYDPTKKAGSCRYDSGGPLTQNGKQVGIVSWGIMIPADECGSETYPAVSTRVSEYIDWIKQHAV